MIKDIKTEYSTFVLLENGDLWGCGKNSNVDLGIEPDNIVYSFKKICENVEKVKHSWCKTFVFKKDKSLWYAGSGFVINKTLNIFPLEKISNDAKDVLYWDFSKEENFLFCLKNNGELVDLLSNKVLLTDTREIKSIDKKDKKYLFALKNDGSLWKFNEKSFSKILDNVKDIFSGKETPFFIQDLNNSLWLVENNFEKTNKLLDNVKDVKISITGGLFLREDGSLFALGENLEGNLGISKKKIDIPTFVNKDVKKIYLNNLFSIILKDDNTLWGSGENINGILCNKNKIANHNFYSFKKISDDVKNFNVDVGSLCIIKQNDELWGAGIIAQYFQGSDSVKFMFKDVKNVFLNSVFERFFVLDKNNSLLCFGDNNYGELGVGSQTKIVNKPIVNNIIRNYYTTKETIKVIKSIYKGENL